MRNKESDIPMAILLSGSGSTAERIIKACRSGELTGITPKIVIANHPNALGLQKAEVLGVDTCVMNRKAYGNEIERYGDDILRILKMCGVDFISQNGWLPLTPFQVVEAYQGNIINQHPGPLDPGRVDFGGKGMYGTQVHMARLAYAWTIGDQDQNWTEATVHYVSEEFDKGAIIEVASLTFANQPQPITIAEMRADPGPLWQATKQLQTALLPIEHELVLKVLQRFGSGESVRGYCRQNPLIPDDYQDVVSQAKQLAIDLHKEELKR